MAETEDADRKSAEDRTDRTDRDDAPYREPDAARAAEQRQRSEDPRLLEKLDKTRTRRAVARWATLLVVLGVFALLYFQHPYYRGNQFVAWRQWFPVLIGLWVVLGIPYSIKTLKHFESKSARSFWFSEASLLWMVVARHAWGRTQYTRLEPREGGPKHAGMVDLSRVKDFPVLGFLWRRRRIKNMILATVVKAFFSPLMLGFVAGHITSFTNHWAQKKGVPPVPLFNGDSFSSLVAYTKTLGPHLAKLIPSGADFAGIFSGASYTLPNIRWGFDMAYDAIFIVDCGFAIVGYLSESRWLGNKTRSVEPTGLGWACAIFCYPPFNNILGTYVPFGNGKQWLTPDAVFFGVRGEIWLLVVRGLIIAFFTVYAAATVAFGAKFSNLTNRGIVARGPYRFIRHPAYTCKCIAWWLEQLHVMNPQTALALVGLCGVYALRAWTEERHLSQDPEYVAYRKKVRWAAIPGLF